MTHAPRRIFLCWEMGAGRNHIAMLIGVAKAMRAAGHVVCGAALVNLELAAELAPYTDAVCPVPKWEPAPKAEPNVRARPNGAFTELLVARGFADHEGLRRGIDGWRDLFIAHRADVVVVDHAPTAALAARALRLPVFTAGVGYTVPPGHMEHYPAAFEVDTPPVMTDDALRDQINDVLSLYGARPLEHLPQIYEVIAEAACTIDIFDPYKAYRLAPRLPPQLPPVVPGSGAGNEVFVYLSASDRFNPVILTAVMTLKVPVRAFVLGASAETRAMMRSRGVVIEDKPLPPQLVAERTRLMLHCGNHGTTCMGLASALPQVCLPQHLENRNNAQALSDRGAGVLLSKRDYSVPRIHEILYDAYENVALRDAAHSLQSQVSKQMTGDTVEQLEVLVRRVV